MSATRITGRPPKRWGLVAATLVLAATLQAQPPAPSFRFERPVTATASGPQRLAIDVPLLTGGGPFSVSGSRARLVAAGGLSDLRFFDPAGTEVPYLLVYAPPAEREWRNGAILPVVQTEKTSGFEADLGQPFVVDALGVEGLPAPFLKRLVLEGSGDRQRWTLLDGEGTLFDLPGEQLRQTELPFTAGTYRYLRVTWDDSNSGRVPLPRRVLARRVGEVSAPPPLTAPLIVERRPSEPGRSRYRIRLPGARLPLAAIELQVDGGHVFREAVVSQARLTGEHAAPIQVGRALLRRIVRDGVVAGSLRIPVTGVTEPELGLVVEDGTNPPLALRGAIAIFAELPWIYFESDPGSLVARYGSSSLRSPAYDLEAVRDRVVVTGLPEAQWGEPRPSSAAAAPALPELLPQAGAPLDPGAFRHVRALPAGEGQLVALAVDAATLARSEGPSGGFADVRLLDDENRQVPYLVERRDEPLPIELAMAPAPADVPSFSGSNGKRWSSYVLELPYDNLPSARLVVETSARVFRRPVRLAAERAPDRQHRERWLQVLASQTWTHASEQETAPPLTLVVPHVRDKRLVLAVDEGDNPSLPLTSARLLLPSYRLRFYRPAGTRLRLAYGRDDLAAPRYDLALLATYVMGAEAVEIEATPESRPLSDATPVFISPRTFWLLLGTSVVLLLILVARLVVKGEPDPGAHAG